jgi:hypothetical protein
MRGILTQAERHGNKDPSHGLTLSFEDLVLRTLRVACCSVSVLFSCYTRPVGFLHCTLWSERMLLPGRRAEEGKIRSQEITDRRGAYARLKYLAYQAAFVYRHVFGKMLHSNNNTT